MSSRIKISSMLPSLSRRVRPGFPKNGAVVGLVGIPRGGLVMVPWCLASKSVHIAPMSVNTGRPALGSAPINPNSRTPQPVAGQKE